MLLLKELQARKLSIICVELAARNSKKPFWLTKPGVLAMAADTSGRPFTGCDITSASVMEVVLRKAHDLCG